MPIWYYDKKELKNTPSFQNGVEGDVEARYRREGARFIINTGTKMGLRYDTMATGVIYFHRFYMFHSFKDFPRYVTACCCLFLAGKVEETPKKCKDIIKTARTLLSDHQFSQFGEDAKEEVMTLERILLQTIKFDLQVDHPYSYLLRYAKSLKGDKQKLQKMVQMAWTFVNDSLCTTLSLQWEPEIIAIALMYLAGKLSKFEVADWNGRLPKHTRWWDMFVEDISMDLLEDICHQVLDLYSNTPNANKIESPPATPPANQIPPVRSLLPTTGPLPPTKSRNNSPAQPIPPAVAGAIPVQIAKVKQEIPPHVKEQKPNTAVPPKKIRLNPQPIPTVTDNLPPQVPVPAVPINATQPPPFNYPPNTEQYPQFPPTAPIPATNYQPPATYPSYPPPETVPGQYETDAHGQYNQPQHYSAPYDNSGTYGNYQQPTQPYYPVPPQTGPYPVGGYNEGYQNDFPPTNPPPVGQYTQPPNYPPPPQNPNYNPVPSYAQPPPRVGPPPGQHLSPNPSGNIAPVRITGRPRQSWN